MFIDLKRLLLLEKGGSELQKRGRSEKEIHINNEHEQPAREGESVDGDGENLIYHPSLNKVTTF